MTKHTGTSDILFRNEELKELISDLEGLSGDFKSIVASASRKWAKSTEKEYSQKIPYANGFSQFPGEKTFSKVTTKPDHIQVSVGHECFLARFLEVGTTSHNVTRTTKNGKRVTNHVSGIRGTHALDKAFDSKMPDLLVEIDKKIQQELSKKLL